MQSSGAWVTNLTVAIVTIVAADVARAQPAGGRRVDASQVVEAIERGVAFLKREQDPRGRWNDPLNYAGGISALCTLAMIHSGVELDDPSLAAALKYLRSLEVDKTYTVALQTMVLCAADPKKDMVLIGRNVRWLESNQIREGPRKGAWSYPGPGGDNSNSQFAVLALYEALRVGASVKRETWERAAEYWRKTQNADGSWGYTMGDRGTGSMTNAGIGALAVASMALEEGDASVEGGRVLCCRPQQDDEALENAIDWLARHFSVTRNPRPEESGQPCLYYYLYGLERVGRLTARRFIGDHDWYREGAEFLVREQDPLSHYWVGTWHMEENPLVSSALALLFLSKGRRPIVMAKLQYGEGNDWNSHRRDAAHLTVVAEEAWDVDLTWQVIDPGSATVEDLLQAPVLYVSGDKIPELMGEAQKLRDYVDRGGFIFAESCCTDSQGFDAGFRRLMAAVFPEEEYGLQQVTPGHPIWRMERLVRPDSPYVGRLWSVDYGCRTCVIYSDADLSCYWELAKPGRPIKHPAPVEQHIEDAVAVGLNVLTYATNREPKGKEEFFNLPLEDQLPSDAERGVIEIAKLRHGGGCNDAPGALMNLLRTASQGDLKLRVRAADKLINISDPSLFRFHLAFMHGRHEFRLTPAERTQLRDYLERGGTLLVDAICASRSFASSLRRELELALPGMPLESIPTSDPIFTAAFGGYDVRRVTLRDPQNAQSLQPVMSRLRQVSPQLEGIKIDGRWAVVFSPYDISCALEQHEAVGCRGYIQEDAARIGLNVLLYSLNQ